MENKHEKNASFSNQYNANWDDSEIPHNIHQTSKIKIPHYFKYEAGLRFDGNES